MEFKANLFLTVLAILVLALLLSLGFWQIDRAAEKQALLDMQSARRGLEPVEIHTVNFNAKSVRYLPVLAEGVLDVNQQILIDNQVKKGKVGYSVLTPLKMRNGTAILLNRGWVPMGSDRAVLPVVDIEPLSLSVTGMLDNFPSVGIKLDKADELSIGWPALTQVVDINKVAERLGYSVLAYQLLLNPSEPNGYNREWVVMKMGPEKHHGYAFQWFALATAWVIIYFVLTVKRREKK